MLDSSSLITLGRAAAIDLLRLSPHKAVTVTEVHRETVEIGLRLGYADASEIERIFRQGVVSLQDPRRKEKLPGISQTDSLVLHLADELAAAETLINDQPLLQKARQRGLVAHYTVEFVQELYARQEISQTRRDKLVNDFLADGRYTEELVRSVLLGGGPWMQ